MDLTCSFMRVLCALLYGDIQHWYRHALAACHGPAEHHKHIATGDGQLPVRDPYNSSRVRNKQAPSLMLSDP